MKVKTHIKAGRLALNHNEARARTPGLQVKTNIKAGRLAVNHNDALVRLALKKCKSR